MFTTNFAKATAERLVKTFVQAFAAAAALGDPGTSVLHLDWAGAAGIAAAAALASLVTSVLSLPAGPDDSPSLVVDSQQ